MEKIATIYLREEKESKWKKSFEFQPMCLHKKNLPLLKNEKLSSYFAGRSFSDANFLPEGPSFILLGEKKDKLTKRF